MCGRVRLTSRYSPRSAAPCRVIQTRMHCLRTAVHCDLCCRIHADTAHTSTNSRTAIASQSGKSMASPPGRWSYSCVPNNCGFIPDDAKTTKNEKAVTNAMPSATAIGREKPSGLMAFSPRGQRRIAIDGRKTVNRFWRHNDLIEVEDRPYEGCAVR